MQIIHLSAECFPVAKVGGLGDVVGALPKYQNQEPNVNAKVVMPYINNKFTQQNDFELDYESYLPFHGHRLKVNILKNSSLGFDLYLVKIEGFDHRTKVYGYYDDNSYFILFQIAALNWINQWHVKPDILHCHDFHSGFVPFMVKHCHQYHDLRSIPTVFTIHNGQYQGRMSWGNVDNFPWFDTWQTPLLEWDGDVNAMASAIKCAWRVTTVSPQYMKELMDNANGLEKLFRMEQGKCSGILNGIDTQEWDPSDDQNLPINYTEKTVIEGKKRNKTILSEEVGFDPKLPLFSFIGRFVDQKGVDVLADAIWSALRYHNVKANFYIIGSGDSELEGGIDRMNMFLDNRYRTYIGYNESLARKVYAASDFMIIPSRFEPCGLNQFYAMRYGTLPVVRTVGGLLDTVKDYEDENGNGVRFIHLSVEDILHAIDRSLKLFINKKQFNKIRKYDMSQDFSWEKSANKYLKLYKSLQL